MRSSVSIAPVAPDMARVREDHGLVQAEQESLWWEAVGRQSLGVSAKQGHRTGWWSAVEWVLRTQTAMDDLTEGQMLAELRKGAGSVFWPLFAADPKFWVDCPTCRVRVLIDAEGLCPACAHEFEEEEI